jgi:hypothetical protein
MATALTGMSTRFDSGSLRDLVYRNISAGRRNCTTTQNHGLQSVTISRPAVQ